MAKTKRTKKQPKTVTLTLTEREARHLWWYLNDTGRQYEAARRAIISNNAVGKKRKAVKEALPMYSPYEHNIHFMMFCKLDDAVDSAGIDPCTPIKG